jgi:hypothetical protein
MPTTSQYRLAKALERLIVVRRDVYAIQTDVGRYCKVDEELTTDVIKQHLEGDKTIGSYIFKDDSFVKWFCFDLDINKSVITKITQNENLSSNDIFNRFKDTLITQSKHIQVRARHYGIYLIPEFSGNKGIHLWGFCDGFIDAGQIRIVMKGILREVDMLSEHFHIDLFPAQDSTDGKLGNFVKLPCGIHKKTGNRCSLLADDYKISEYSYESQLELLFDIAMGDNLVTAGLIESLQEEFELDEIPVEAHKEQLEITEETLSELSTSDSKVERIFSNCDTFSEMIKTAKDTGYLTHAQRLAIRTKRYEKVIREFLSFTDIINNASKENLLIIIPPIVEDEWKKHEEATIKAFDDFVKKLDNDIIAIRELSNLMQIKIDGETHFSDKIITKNLQDITNQFFDASCFLDENNECKLEANQRVIENIPPSMKGKGIQDCTIYLHSLELVKKLRKSNFDKKCVFITSNKNDFFEGNTAIPKQPIEKESNEVNLKFVDNWQWAKSELIM